MLLENTHRRQDKNVACLELKLEELIDTNSSLRMPPFDLLCPIICMTDAPRHQNQCLSMFVNPRDHFDLW